MEQGGMTHTQCLIYRAKRQREQPEREALLRRLRQAEEVVSLYLDSLAYLRRFVVGVEALTEQLRLEEKALPSFRGSAFLRELVMENYALWPETLYGPFPLTPSGAREGKDAYV